MASILAQGGRTIRAIVPMAIATTLVGDITFDIHISCQYWS